MHILCEQLVCLLNEQLYIIEISRPCPEGNELKTSQSLVPALGRMKCKPLEESWSTI